MTGPESMSNGPVSCPPSFVHKVGWAGTPPLQGLGYRLRLVPESEGKRQFSEVGWYREPFRPCIGCGMVLFIYPKTAYCTHSDEREK